MDLLLAFRSSFRHALTVAFLAISCSAVSSCLPFRPSPECRAFYDLTLDQQEAKVRASPLESQLDLYWCGWFQEPPTDFAEEIADGGTQIVPSLLEKLKAEKSETHQNLIIHIFEEMAKKGYLRDKRDVLEQLRQVVSKIKHSDIKKESQQRLQIIEHHL